MVSASMTRAFARVIRPCSSAASVAGSQVHDAFPGPDALQGLELAMLRVTVAGAGQDVSQQAIGHVL
jgi:hypothetical protein